MTGRSLTNYNELNCLEYETLKIPYELLNKKFRITQRLIDQCYFHFQREFDLLENKLGNKIQPISLSEVADNLQKLHKLINQFKVELERKINDEVGACEDLDKQIRMLSQAGSSDPTIRKFFYDQRLNRFIIEHLLRTGNFETAQTLANYVGLDIQAQKSVFCVARQVEESLKQKDLTLCLNWVKDNRSRLHRLGSSFETEVRVQQCVELVKEAKTAEALKYVQTFFGNKSDLYGAQWTGNSNLLRLMGLIALGKNSTRSEHQSLLSDDRYNNLIMLFRNENERIYKFSSQSSFSACLQAGIAVHKTPQCKNQSDSRCVVCSSVYELSEGLPYTHLSNSRLFCYISGEPFDCDDNRPMMLPNGYVYGEKSIRSLAKNNEFLCPRTLAVFSLDDLQRVYVF